MQVGDGLTDFTPSPQESRAIIKAGYACPATLLVQFENDNFDETPEMQLLLSERQAGSSGGAADSSLAAAGTAAAGGQASVPQSGYTSAWNSIDEDVSMDNLLQQLQELQASLAQQEQQRQRQQTPGGAPELQQLLLQGSHVTPCGAQLQGSLGPSPFDVLLSSSSSSGSQAQLQNLAQQVVSFLGSRRPQATLRRAAMQQVAQQQQPIMRNAGGAAGGSAGAGEETAAPAAAVATATGQGS